MTSSGETLLKPGIESRISNRVGVFHSGHGGSDRELDGDSSSPLFGRRIAIVCAEFNGGITERLLNGAIERLEEAGCPKGEVEVAWVAGAFELPLASQCFARQDRIAAVVALGAVIRGDTAHFDFVAGECARGLMQVALDTGVPTIFGVLTTDTVDQALERSLADSSNKGREAVDTALQQLAAMRSNSATGH